jgi:hypothetical protein
MVSSVLCSGFRRSVLRVKILIGWSLSPAASFRNKVPAFGHRVPQIRGRDWFVIKHDLGVQSDSLCTTSCQRGLGELTLVDVERPRRCLIVQEAHLPVNSGLIQTLISVGFAVDQCDCFDAFVDTLALNAKKPTWKLVVLDLDYISHENEMECVVDRLLALRCISPKVVFVLLSRKFLRDDFGTERLFVADAGLRTPVYSGRLKSGLDAAFQNNALWQIRLEARA